MSVCLHCDGRGYIGPVHLNYGNGKGEWKDSIPCHDCAGSGKWSDRRARAYLAGQARRRERIARDESLRECAQKMGVSAADLCAMERGKKPFPPCETEGV